MTITPAPATKKAARGLHCVAISPPRTKPRPGVAEAADSSVPSTRACMFAAVSSWTALITATHWMPLPRPPRDRGCAGDRKRWRGRHAEVAGADRDGAEEEENRQRGASQPGEDDAAADHPSSPAGEQEAVAGVSHAERFLRVDHLDRDHDREEDERSRLRGEQAPQRRVAADVPEPGPHSLPQAGLRFRLGLGQRLRRQQDPADRVEGGGVQQQRRLDAEGRDHARRPGPGRPRRRR